ncbi:MULTISPECIES: hypothetical protein [unclassified Streptomyces]|nr:MULTISPECIES: hypothetical protein [unclassified Streptomyces]MCY0922689.1 hypothetical protein [Streptomyces sp. H27-G5]MCY0957938.1 hypothetical protein [Streptomyces sp. H27-H5]
MTLGSTTTGRSFVMLSAYTGGKTGGKAAAVSRFLDTFTTFTGLSVFQ